MSFYRRRALGFFIIDDLLEAATAIKGVQSLVSNASGMFSGSTDQKRLARANFFRDSALAGSVTAARYMLGGLQNVGGNEKPYYTAAWQTLASNANGSVVASEATAQGALWNVNDVAGDPSKSQMITDVQQDLVQLGKSVAAPTSTTTTSGVPATTHSTMLPAMTTTASYNWVPVAAVSVLGLGAIALATRGRPRGRR